MEPGGAGRPVVEAEPETGPGTGAEAEPETGPGAGAEVDPEMAPGAGTEDGPVPEEPGPKEPLRPTDTSPPAGTDDQQAGGNDDSVSPSGSTGRVGTDAGGALGFGP
ncbi:hypothetical protein [Ornithinimicrobium sp. CNJ-824]|uniref:hypothetical protein n=1 Tax=Ornithinimicrobium sp. CNJ-824 TaxID=1904966 RepID=UPI00117E28F7|nr:hypothetical protein [Ornithinimicrobium sp. CNJ-824]